MLRFPSSFARLVRAHYFLRGWRVGVGKLGRRVVELASSLLAKTDVHRRASPAASWPSVSTEGGEVVPRKVVGRHVR